jgi:hypothetical protein
MLMVTFIDPDGLDLYEFPTVMPAAAMTTTFGREDLYVVLVLSYRLS